MQSVIHSFQPEARLPATLDALTPIYRSVLANAGRILLLLDNAAADAQVRPLLPPPNCLLLVTSRQQFALPGLETRNLDCLAPEKSRELLLKLAPRLEGHAAEAAELCGHLPLALEVFAGAVNDKRLYPVPELLDRLRTRQDKLAPVEATFQVSYEMLSEGLRGRWTLLAVFPTSFDLRAATAVWKETVDSARDAMQTLVNASLVEWNEISHRVRLHDLVRQFCDDRLAEVDRTAAQFRHANHYRDVAAEAERLYLKGGENVLRGLELFDCERAHLEAAFAWLQPRRDRDSVAMLVSLTNAVAYTGDLRFHPRQRILWLGVQLEAARIAENRAAEGAALGNLGTAYADLGDARKAIEFFEQCLQLHREIGDRRGQGAALGNLGNAYADLGHPRKAIEFFEQQLVIVREIGNRRGEGNALFNSALALDKLGDRAQAIARAEAALRIFEAVEDPNAATVRAKVNEWRC
jgi:tetratricopeptide (TPR) repeat protein